MIIMSNEEKTVEELLGEPILSLAEEALDIVSAKRG